MKFQYSTDGGLSFADAPQQCIWKFGPIYEAGSTGVALMGTGATNTYGGTLNAGPGFNRNFHMSFIYACLGSETGFRVRVQLDPGEVGIADGAISDPYARIEIGGCLSSYILRKGL